MRIQAELVLAALRDAAATERRATVGWLRAKATDLRGRGVAAHDLADVIDDLADAIERGEHLGDR